MLEKLDCQILFSLLQAFHARPFLILKSFSELLMWDPKYLKSLTSLILIPFNEVRGRTFPEELMNSVFPSLQ